MQFRYVLSDVWYASVENMKYIKDTMRRDFVIPLKINRKVALSAAEKRSGKYITVETLQPKVNEHLTVYLEGFTSGLGSFVRSLQTKTTHKVYCTLSVVIKH